MSDAPVTLHEAVAAKLRREITDNVQAKLVKMGDTVHVWGPWSNGHDEQAAIVTHTHGNGQHVNLFVLVDEGAPMSANQVPFFITRAAAMQYMTDAQAVTNTGGPVVAYFPE
jgi:hypothetical protein